MQFSKTLMVGVAALAFVAQSAIAQSDKAKKQAEILKAAQTSLNDFYKADPKIKADVEKGAGYAVFTTYGFSFVLGGAGGKGVAHDNKTKKNTFMELGQASAGLQLGASETRYLFIFSDEKSLNQFIDKGWDASMSGGGSAGTGTKSAGTAEGVFTGGKMYALTKTGLQIGAAAAGTKVWKDKELN